MDRWASKENGHRSGSMCASRSYVPFRAERFSCQAQGPTEGHGTGLSEEGWAAGITPSPPSLHIPDDNSTHLRIAWAALVWWSGSSCPLPPFPRRPRSPSNNIILISLLAATCLPGARFVTSKAGYGYPALSMGLYGRKSFATGINLTFHQYFLSTTPLLSRYAHRDK